MKKLSNIVAYLSILTLCQAQQTSQPTSDVPSPTPYAIVSRDGNSRVWESTSYSLSPSGQVVPQVHRYTELATGLCYQQNGQWVDSQQQINILPDGSAAATNGQHQAYFPANIYNGVITLITPDGLQLQSQPVGLSYDDGTNTVLIAELTNSVGELISSNQIVYPNAFTGIDADLLYTYKKGRFEQDVVFRGQPPTPEQLGLSSDSARLQMITEFFNPPVPKQIVSPANSKNGMQDTTLAFGTMRMIRGHAFLSGTTSPQSKPNQIDVYKTWEVVNGRALLIEELPYQTISSQLATLPQSASRAVNSRTTLLGKISSKRLLPPARLTAAITNSLPLAKAEFVHKRGVVLDYVTIDSTQTNFTFQGDTTYYISDQIEVLGTTIFEGGTVVKYGPSGDYPEVYCDDVISQTAPYRPAIFTTMDDNTVGEKIDGSSGSPFTDSGLYYLQANNCPQNARFLYAGLAFTAQEDPAVWNVQFINCFSAIDDASDNSYNGTGQVSVHNTLFANCQYDVSQDSLASLSILGENLTVDGSDFFSADSANLGGLTNCIFTRVDGGTNGLSFQNCLYTNTATGIYQTVGGGNYYLANGSPCRGAGTTNIDPALLADLAGKTTQPPMIYSNDTFSVATNIRPYVARDNGSPPDLGYHYDALDYIFGGCNLNGNQATFAPGTAVAWFLGYGSAPSSSGQPYGIALENGANLSFNGTLTQPCYFSYFDMIQEGNNNWKNTSAMPGLMFDGTNAESELSADFTKFTSSYGNNVIVDNASYGKGGFQNCEFYNVNISTYNMQSLNFTNCLFFRDIMPFWDQKYDLSFTFENCTFYGGGIALVRSGVNPSFWQAENCSFDGTALWWSDVDHGAGSNTVFAYNAYNTNNLDWQNYLVLDNPTTNLLEGDLDDVTVTNFNWASGRLGNFYLPWDSLLIEKGSTTANLLGLYWFTTQTNQTLESNNIVDIGYHYVVTDTNGNPLDSIVPGTPDYSSYPDGPLAEITNGLVVWYPLAGDTLDHWGTDTATPKNAAAYTNGVVGWTNTALLFPGNQGLTANDSALPMGTNSRTISFWVYLTQLPVPGPTVAMLFEYGDVAPNQFVNCYLQNNSGTMDLGIYAGGSGGAALFPFNPPLNQWFNLTIKIESSSNSAVFYLYENGILNNSETLQPPQTASGGTLGIGYWNNTNYISGAMADFRIYNAALSPAQLMTNFLAVYTSKTILPDLLYLKMQDDINATPEYSYTNWPAPLVDSSGNGNIAATNYEPVTNDASVWLTDGVPDNAMHFHGDPGSYIDTHDTNDFAFTNQNYTINAWVYPDTENGVFLACGIRYTNGWALYEDGINDVYFDTYSNGVSSGSGGKLDVGTTSFNDICYVVQGGTNVSAYLNGGLEYNGIINLPAPPGTNSLWLGRQNTGAGSPSTNLDGNVWQPQIWSTNLSPSDVSKLYYEQLNGIPWP